MIQVELLGGVNATTIEPFVAFVGQSITDGETEFVVAISSWGGSVFWGLSAHNFLKGCGATITTHNFGHVNSIASAIFSAGSVRRCVPSGRFLIHDISWTVNGEFSEVQLHEFSEGLKADRRSVATVISGAVNLTPDEVEQMMRESHTVHVDQAQTLGLVTEVREQIFDPQLPIYRFHST